ncbi:MULTISPECIES: toll/interleukin-1 receptor domain-containing protein [Protofrankia]|uniref:toll/interleukin-1 receptor domain-containing protein n=1 Tax=Protofrankia TaxID=2994361 RepID=UPI0006404C8A|nr:MULTISPECIES: toll/interleukin-1 receptor domain-containing protein [Protofrankia]
MTAVVPPDEGQVPAGGQHPVRDRVFVSYSHQDRAWLERLQVHLRPLERTRKIDLWADTRLHAGDDWRKEINAVLDRAKVAILLVTADFLASDFIANEELPPLLDAAANRGCRIIPVIIKPSLFAHTPALARFQAINPPDRPLSTMSEHEREDVLFRVALTLMNDGHEC